MSTLKSTLLLTLIDNVSGGAKKVRSALHGVDADARRFSGKGGAAAFLAGGGRMALGAAGAYFSAGAAKQAFQDYAGLERRLTYIRLTGDATREQMDEARQGLTKTARATAKPLAEIVDGFDSLVAAGRSVPEAMAFIPAVAATAAVADANIVDVAKSADALGVSMGIAGDRMQEAFDKMVVSGRLGKFEVKDMAQHLPSLLPLAASRGFKGMEGLEKVVTYLQLIRQGTGSSEEAADSFKDMLGKLSSTETVNKFKKFGIDVTKEMKKVRAAGGNEFERMFELIQQAMKKGAQVTDLFQDVQAYRGWLAFNQSIAQTPQFLAKVKAAIGTVAKNLGDVTTDAAAAVQNLSTAWDKAMREMARSADNAGVSKLLDGIANAMEARNRLLEAKDPQKEFVAMAKEQGVGEKAATDMYGFWTGDFGGKSDPYLAKDLEKQADSARFRLKRLQEEEDAIYRTNGDAPSEYSRLAGVDQPTGQQRIQLEMARRRAQYFAEEMVRIRAARAAAQKEFDDATSRSVDNFLGPGLYNPQVPGEFSVPGPRDKPNRFGDVPLPPVKPVSLGTNVDEASVMAAADEIRRKAQAYVDRNPIVIPVRAGTVAGIGAAIGREVQNGLDGSYSDNNGRR